MWQVILRLEQRYTMSSTDNTEKSKKKQTRRQQPVRRNYMSEALGIERPFSPPGPEAYGIYSEARFHDSFDLFLPTATEEDRQQLKSQQKTQHEEDDETPRPRVR
jgi:hypothetical protein